MPELEQAINELCAVNIVFGFALFLVALVVSFFVCRLLLAIAKWFEAKTAQLRHDFAVNNYRDED